MTKTFLEAIRALPPEWVREHVEAIQVTDTRVVFAHPDLAPITVDCGIVKPIEFRTLPLISAREIAERDAEAKEDSR